MKRFSQSYVNSQYTKTDIYLSNSYQLQALLDNPNAHHYQIVILIAGLKK